MAIRLVMGSSGMKYELYIEEKKKMVSPTKWIEGMMLDMTRASGTINGEVYGIL